MAELLTIDHVGHRGDGVAFANGRTAYVPYTLAGEGKVIWVKAYDPAEPQKPHGMGVQFVLFMKLLPKLAGIDAPKAAREFEDAMRGESTAPLPGTVDAADATDASISVRAYRARGLGIVTHAGPNGRNLV